MRACYGRLAAWSSSRPARSDDDEGATLNRAERSDRQPVGRRAADRAAVELARSPVRPHHDGNAVRLWKSIALQRALGNQGVRRANAVVDRCVGGSQPCSCNEAKPVGREAPVGSDQWQGTTAPGVPAVVTDVLRSAGSPLPDAVRVEMERRFDVAARPDSAMPPVQREGVSEPGDPHEREAEATAARVSAQLSPSAMGPTHERTLGNAHHFSEVRIHVDSRAGIAARAIDAAAYTVGNDIVFGAGRFDPGTREGMRLLAHELTHVVQRRPELGRSRIAQNTVLRAPVSVAPPAHTPKQTQSTNDCNPANRVQHNREHRIIQQDYVRRQNPVAVKEYQIPNSSALGYTGWADLADRAAKTLYEIKSVWEWSRGQEEVDRYIDMANVYCGSGWSGGTDYIPTIFEDPGDPNNVLLAASPSPGLILYTWFRRDNPTGKIPAEFKRKVEIPQNEQTKASVPKPNASTPDARGNPGPTPMPLPAPGPTPARPPAPTPGGGEVIPFPKPPQTKPGEQELQPAAKTTTERILEFVTDLIVSGENVERAVTKFLSENPAIVQNITLIVAAIAAGALVSDVASGFTAIVKDPAVLAILAAMLRVAQTLQPAR